MAVKGEGRADIPQVIFTLGTSTRGMEEFIAILRARNIARVCDVRSFPGSRRYPQFSREAFAASLREAGIDYVWLGEQLGGYRKGGYEAHMKTPDFEAGLEELQRLASLAPSVVVCAEALPWRCHRRFIAGALEERGWKVIHVIDASRDWAPVERGRRLPLFEE
ncbi:MAG: DUF488 domain-containing protein [Actinobacteria bacterium]|nr:DUF488 domain-containing protein [Actinomycetota bacterium]